MALGAGSANDRPSLTRIVATLRRQHGAQRTVPKTAFECVLWENCAYLSRGDRRGEAYALLKRTVGLSAKAIVSAPMAKLVAVTRHGILAEHFARVLRECAEIALGEFDGNVDKALSPDRAKATKQLQKFPGVAVPGAERILVAVGRLRALALESNGMRVLKRVGYGPGTFKTWFAEYRAVIADVPIGRATVKQLHSASLLLQKHGQTICKTSKPQCGACPLLPVCAFGRQQ